jgi:hypothetical protein
MAPGFLFHGGEGQPENLLTTFTGRLVEEKINIFKQF